MSQRSLFALFSLLALPLGAGGGEISPPIRKGLDTIHATEAMAHVKFLASPELEGRDTGQRGCEAAAEYLAAQYEHFGLAPFGDEKDGKRTFFQHYPITRSLADPKSGLRATLADGTTRELLIGKEVAPLTAMPSREIAEDARVVDGGAITIPKADNASRPEGAPRVAPPSVSVTLPPECEGAFVLFHVSALEPRDRFRLFAGVSNAMRDAKAAGALFVPAAEEPKEAWAKCFEASALTVRTAQVSLGANPSAPASAAASRPNRRGTPGAGAPMLILASAVEGLAGGKAAVSLARKQEVTSATNVVAMVHGSDPELSKEFVICSAHYDHVGFQGGVLHPGADDNASGTSALLEIAQAFASTEPPKRSVIFLSVSGEEKNLWGSSHFVAHPPVPLTQIVGDLNTDMVGRTMFSGKALPARMLMTPSKGHPSFNTLAARALEIGPDYGFPGMESGDIYWQRSDHYNFAKNGIPVMFLCNGEHEDYHQPGDTPDKIDGDKIERAAKLTFQLAYEVATAAARPKVIGAPASKPAK